jgi:integrase/recombinase XerD
MKLQQSIDRYVYDKQAAGLAFLNGNRNLNAFYRSVGDISLETIRPEQILRFLDSSKAADVTWVRKYNLLRAFFLYWLARDRMRSLPMPPPRRPAKRTFFPYIYSQAEVRHLLETARTAQANPSCIISHETFRALLLLLYGTGVLVSEALRLSRNDVDLIRKLVVIRNNRLEPSRQIPLGPDLIQALRSYSKAHHKKTSKGQCFFLDKQSKPLNGATLLESFQRLRSRAGITRRDGIALAPRMQDLRYTFAVHRLTAWYKHGANLSRMIPALSVYMGYLNLSSSARFLYFTPERFRTQLDKLSPRRKNGHWRDDPGLMKFLATL